MPILEPVGRAVLWVAKRHDEPDDVILYTTNGAVKKVIETFQIDRNDLVVATEVFHGKVPACPGPTPGTWP